MCQGRHAQVAAEREAERVYARREAQRDDLIRGSWNMTADADGAHRIKSLHGVDQVQKRLNLTEILTPPLPTPRSN
jgi:hypothetical protein